MNKVFSKARGLPAGGQGFTLMELLTVVAIIGILAAIVIVSLNSSKAKARDAQRAQDIANIQGALEVYFSQNGSYPSCPQEPDNPAGWNCLVTALQTSGLMPQVPNDPLGGSTSYSYDNYCYTPSVYDIYHYRLWATGETQQPGGIPPQFVRWSSTYIIGATNCQVASN